jgi:hypothetical protein
VDAAGAISWHFSICFGVPPLRLAAESLRRVSGLKGASSDGRFHQRDVTIITAGFVVGAFLVAVLTWQVVEVLTSSPSDPLTKAGGLAPTQDIRKAR